MLTSGQRNILEKVEELRSIHIDRKICNTQINHCLNLFCDHLSYLVNDGLTTGISLDSIFMDVYSLENMLANPYNENFILTFRNRVKLRQFEYLRVKNTGIGVGVTGGLFLFGAACATFMTAGIPALVIGGTAVVGGTMIPGGTGVAMNAENKIGTLALYEQALLHALINSLLDNRVYTLVARVCLNSILIDAQKRGLNQERDDILNDCVSAIHSHNASQIIIDLKKAYMKLKTNSPSSKAAIELDNVIKDLRNKYISQLHEEGNYLEIFQHTLHEIIEEAVVLNQESMPSLNMLNQKITELHQKGYYPFLFKMEVQSIMSKLTDMNKEYFSKLTVLLESLGSNVSAPTLTMKII